MDPVTPPPTCVDALLGALPLPHGLPAEEESAASTLPRSGSVPLAAGGQVSPGISNASSSSAPSPLPSTDAHPWNGARSVHFALDPVPHGPGSVLGGAVQICASADRQVGACCWDAYVPSGVPPECTGHTAGCDKVTDFRDVGALLPQLPGGGDGHNAPPPASPTPAASPPPCPCTPPRTPRVTLVPYFLPDGLSPLSEEEEKEVRALAACRAADFEVLERLGGGSFADVFLVKCTASKHPFPSKRYALKAAKNYDANSRSIVNAHFLAEIEILMDLGMHPNLVQYWCTLEDALPPTMMALLSPDDRAVMEEQARSSADGRVWTTFAVFDHHPFSLKSLLQRLGRLPGTDFAKMALQLFDGCLFLEQHRVLHRDVKPDNVLWKGDGNVCICDLGDALKLPVRGPVIISSFP